MVVPKVTVCDEPLNSSDKTNMHRTCGISRVSTWMCDAIAKVLQGIEKRVVKRPGTHNHLLKKLKLILISP